MRIGACASLCKDSTCLIERRLVEVEFKIVSPVPVTGTGKTVLNSIQLSAFR